MPADAPNVPSVLSVLPAVKGLKCLDLACGLGRYSHLLIEQGAEHVVGLDISEGMIAGAKESVANLPPEQAAKFEFRTEDCSQPAKIAGGPFDLVFAAWFLNYARDYEAMLAMWKNIYSNLKPGGRLVAIVPNLSLNMDAPLDPRYGMTVGSIGKVKDGWRCRLTAFTEPLLQFEMYHLSQEVYVKCAQEAGMADFNFHPHVLPEDERKHSGYWDVYNERPHFEVLTARREPCP